MRMRNYLPIQLTAGTLNRQNSEMDEIEAIFHDLILSMEDMCDSYQTEMETVGRLERWKGHIPTVERDFREYSMQFSPVMEQLLSSKGAGTASCTSKSFQEEQLKLLKEQNELSKRKLDVTANETLIEIDFKKSVAIKKAKAKVEHILSDVELLVEEVSKVGNWKIEGNLELCETMMF